METKNPTIELDLVKIAERATAMLVDIIEFKDGVTDEQRMNTMRELRDSIVEDLTDNHPEVFERNIASTFVEQSVQERIVDGLGFDEEDE